jgi:hypothetical protein
VLGRNDTLVKANRDFAAALTERNGRHAFVVSEGNDRRPGWRRDLADFAPKLF